MITPLDALHERLPADWMDNIATTEDTIIDALVEIALHKKLIAAITVVVE
jgi:hypothetical protein